MKGLFSVCSDPLPQEVSDALIERGWTPPERFRRRATRRAYYISSHEGVDFYRRRPGDERRVAVNRHRREHD